MKGVRTPNWTIISDPDVLLDQDAVADQRQLEFPAGDN
jgi:hypothetical protein